MQRDAAPQFPFSKSEVVMMIDSTAISKMIVLCRVHCIENLLKKDLRTTVRQRELRKLFNFFHDIGILVVLQLSRSGHITRRNQYRRSLRGIVDTLRWLDAQLRLKRRRKRGYLTRAGLHQFPREMSAWARLRDNGADLDFIATMGLDRASFKLLLAPFAGIYSKSGNSPFVSKRTGSGKGDEDRLSRRIIDASGCLGLVLHWLTSRMTQKRLGQIFAVTQGTVSVYLRYGLAILEEVLMGLPLARWSWPKQDHDLEVFARLIRKKEPILQSAWGFIDGLNVPILQPSDIDEQNAYYNGWLGDTFCSQVFVFTPDGAIAYAILNMPGSFHDARIAKEGGLWARLRKIPRPYAIVADSAFPRAHADDPELYGKLLRVRKENERPEYVESANLEAVEQAMERSITSLRQSAEWGTCSYAAFTTSLHYSSSPHHHNPPPPSQ